MLLRSFHGLVIEFPDEKDPEIRVGDKQVVITKCEQNSKNRTILGRIVRIVVLTKTETEGEEVPLSEVKVPVLPDGSSAIKWGDFCALARANASEQVVLTRFAYVPHASTRASFAPWCLKTFPEVHISHVEDEIAQGISAYRINVRLHRLDLLARHIPLLKDRKGHPVLIELVLIHEERQIYQDPDKRVKLCKLLSEVIGNCVKIVVKSKAGDGKLPAAKAGKDDDLKAGQCEIVEAIERSEGLHGMWLAVRYGLESSEHVSEFMSQIGCRDIIQRIENNITTHEIRESKELEPLRRAIWPKGCSALARLNSMTPAFSSPDSILSELLELRSHVAQSPHLELFRWNGLTLRYKGFRPWVQRHVHDAVKRPYYYLDQVTEETLYSSSGIVYVENETDFNEAVQNVVHRECSSRTAMGDFVLYLTNVKSYLLSVRSAHPDLAIDPKHLLQGGAKVPILMDSTFSEARSALRKVLGQEVFFSYVYKAEVHVALDISVSKDFQPELYEEYKNNLLDAIHELMELSRDEWRNNFNVRRNQSEDSIYSYVHISLKISGISIWRAQQIMHSLLRLEDMPIQPAESADAPQLKKAGNSAALQVEDVTRRQVDWLKSRILDCMQEQLQVDSDKGALGFHRANLRLPTLPLIVAPKKIVDHAEEFQEVLQILSEDSAWRGELAVDVQGDYRLICFTQNSQAKAMRLMNVRRELARAEETLRQFEESLETSVSDISRKDAKIQSMTLSPAQREGHSKENLPELQEIIGPAPQPPGSVVWGSWKPAAAHPGSQFNADLFFEGDPATKVAWVTAGERMFASKPFNSRQWYQVQRIMPVTELRKVGTSPIEWFVVPCMGMTTWVNAKVLMDRTWRDTQPVAISTENPEKLDVEQAPKVSKSFFGNLGRKAATSENATSEGPSKATIVAVQTILALVMAPCVELVETLWKFVSPGSPSVPEQITAKDLLSLSDERVQDLLKAVVWNWIDVNVNVQYVRARQYISRIDSESEKDNGAKGSKPQDKSSKAALERERFREKSLADLRLAVRQKKSEVSKLKLESESNTSGESRLVVGANASALPKLERKLDVIQVPWECSWETMTNRMQVLTGHNTDDLIFVFHTDVDVELCAMHSIMSSKYDDAAKKSNVKNMRSPDAKRPKASDLDAISSLGQTLKSHPSVSIMKVEQELMKYSDIVHLNRTGKGTASTGDVLFMMQRVSKALVSDENVYVWKQGVEDGADWVVLLYQGQYPWLQRKRGSYAYFDIVSKQMLYLHRGLAEYVVTDKRSFSVFCRKKFLLKFFIEIR